MLSKFKASLPGLEGEAQVGITTFVDDIACKTGGHTEEEIENEAKAENEAIDRALEKPGGKQHKGKQKNVTTFMGAGSVTLAKQLQKSEQFPDRLYVAQIYLGDRFHCKFASAGEFAWQLMGGFWSTSCSLRHRFLALQSFVQSANLGALIARTGLATAR